jgi:hypothetical protein
MQFPEFQRKHQNFPKILIAGQVRFGNLCARFLKKREKQVQQTVN